MFKLISIDNAGKQVGDNCRREDTDKSRHHKRVVQQILADDGGSGTVEVYRCNITRIVGNEEVSVDGGKNAEQYGASYA